MVWIIVVLGATFLAAAALDHVESGLDDDDDDDYETKVKTSEKKKK